MGPQERAELARPFYTSVWLCVETGQRSTRVVGGECPIHHADACLARYDHYSQSEAQRDELVQVARAGKNMPVAVEERCVLCERSYPAHDSDCPVAAFGQALASLSPATAALLEGE